MRRVPPAIASMLLPVLVFARTALGALVLVKAADIGALVACRRSSEVPSGR
ncbi:hypothetical protein [Actinomadura napierensis]